MNELPTISQYADSIANSYGLTKTLGEIRAEFDAYGNVKFRAGNTAAVFRVRIDDTNERLTLKCFIKNTPHSKAIYQYLSTIDDPLLTSAKLLESELYVYDAFDNGQHYDVAIYTWVEGNTLDEEIRRAANEFGADRFAQLANSFDKLAVELLRREWAHGDLKPENIIVTESGDLKLIDYDAMFIPSLIGMSSSEIGTPTYQHPARDENFFNQNIDDYPSLLISISLHALALKPDLFEKYNHGDNIILDPADILSGNSQAFEDILKLFAASGRSDLYYAASFLKSTRPKICNILELLPPSKIETSPPEETPVLFEKNGLWGYEIKDLKVVIAPIYESATEFSCSLAVVKLHGIWMVIDRCGRTVIQNSTFNKIKPFSENMAAVEVNGRWGYIDISGEIVIAPSFDLARPMSEGMAVVKTNGKYGFIDKHGDIVIEPQYDHATSFRDGKATAYKADKIHQIDRHDICFRQ